MERFVGSDIKIVPFPGQLPDLETGHVAEYTFNDREQRTLGELAYLIDGRVPGSRSRSSAEISEMTSRNIVFPTFDQDRQATAQVIAPQALAIAPRVSSPVGQRARDVSHISIGGEFNEQLYQKLPAKVKVSVGQTEGIQHNGQLYIVWRAGERSGKILKKIDIPTKLRTFNRDAVNTTVDGYLRAIMDGQDRFANADRLTTFLYGLYHGNGETSRLGVRQYLDNDVREFIQEVENAGSVSDWLIARAKALGYEKPNNIFLSIDKFYLGPYYLGNHTFPEQKEEGKNIYLSHATYDRAFPHILNLGGLASPNRLNKEGISKETGEFGTKGSYWGDNNIVSFYSGREARDTARSFGRTPGFDLPMLFSITQETVISKSADDPWLKDDSDPRGGKGVEDFVSLNDISYAFVPYFKVAEVEESLRQHGYPHIRVHPIGYNGDNTVSSSLLIKPAYKDQSGRNTKRMQQMVASSPVTILAELGVPENESQIAQLSKPEISRALRELQGKIDKKIIIEEEPAEEDAAKELIMRAAGINRSDPPFGAINVIKEQDSFVPIVRDIVDNPRKLFVITGPMGAGKSIFSNKLASDVKRALEQKGSSLKVDVLDRDDYMAKDRKVPTLGVKDPQSYDPSTIYIVEGHGITKGVADTYYKRAVIDPVQKEIVSIGFFAPYDVAGERLRSRSREGDETLIPLFDDYYDDWYFGEDFSDYKYMVVSEMSASSPVVHREIAARKLAAATPAQVRKIVLGAYQGIKPAGEIREIGQKIIEMQQRQPGAFESYQRLGQAAPEVAAIVTDLGAAEAIDRTIAVEVGAQLQAPGIAQVISQPQVVQGIDTDFRVRLIPQATMPQAQVSQTMP
ncbi:MAG: hypothetical protein KAR31_02890, partial [Candidatus Omnitrophica bacterium]|nr:hypothetical protein [Candidatus Omnitrophota bacterium]